MSFLDISCTGVTSSWQASGSMSASLSTAAPASPSSPPMAAATGIGMPWGMTTSDGRGRIARS